MTVIWFYSVQGDSGGSAMYQNKLAGVANFVVYGCGSENADGYAKVSFYADWIRDKMGFVWQIVCHIVSNVEWYLG